MTTKTDKNGLPEYQDFQELTEGMFVHHTVMGGVCPDCEAVVINYAELGIRSLAQLREDRRERIARATRTERPG